MKYIILIIFLISFSSCTFFKSKIFDETSAKENLLISVIENPNNIDSIIKNSTYYNKNITKFVENKGLVEELKTNINKFNTNGYKFKINTKYYLSKDNITIDEFELVHELGVVFNENYRSISAKFVLIESEWILRSIGLPTAAAFP